jgi:hypothetical protein
VRDNSPGHCDASVKQPVALAAKVQIAATETLREISAVTRKKIALNFLFTAANKLSFAQCQRGDLPGFVWEYRSRNFPVTFFIFLLVTTICRV